MSPAWQPFLGNYSLPITRHQWTTQRLFDEGLMLAFNFNQHEARIRFNATITAEADSCPMCWWGLAYSHGPYLNQPHGIRPEDRLMGLAAAKRAAKLVAVSPGRYTPKERGLVEVMSQRFPESSSDNWTAVAAHHVTHMEKLHAALPDDDDVAVFLAEALMLTMCGGLNMMAIGYHFYNATDGTPLPYTKRAEALLLAVMRRDATHPYAPHLHVHLTEPSRPSNASSPTFNTSGASGAARGLPSAQRLAASMAATDSQHLLHMPAHTYLRTGRYREAYYQNEIVAHTADAHYLNHGQRPYAPAHNAAFGLYGACMAGMYRAAQRASATLRTIYVAYPDRADGPGPELGWGLQLTTLLRFGDFRGVVAFDSSTPRPWPFAHVVRHYANGSALIHVGRYADAFAALSQLDASAANASVQYASLVKVARGSLVANLQANAATGHAGLLSAIATLQSVVDEQVSWAYDEPPKWHMPMRQCLGRLLLRAASDGRRHELASRAYDTFRADLAEFPANGYSLWGLQQAMVLQPEIYSAADVQRVGAQLKAAWAHTDRPQNTSCAAFDPPAHMPMMAASVQIWRR